MAYGAVTRSLVRQVAELEKQVAELRQERVALNLYVARVSDHARALTRKIEDLQKSKKN